MALEYGSVDAAAGQLAPAQLPYPAGVIKHRIYWRYALAIIPYHLLALLAFSPWFFSWTGVVLVFVGTYVFGVGGMTLCYHRLLTHRSFSTPLWFEHFLAVIAVCCLEDTPARWVAVHRKHHHETDEQPDPHSPLVSWFWSHMGWLLVENTETSKLGLYDRYARDIIRDRFYVKLERYYVPIVLSSWVVFFGAGFGVALLLGNDVSQALQFGASIWLWGVVVRTVVVWHITWSVNSFPHLWGYRNYETNDNSRNNIWVAIVASGEGWHNNHHAYPQSANNAHRPGEFDLTYRFIRLLERVGLAWNVVLPNRR